MQRRHFLDTLMFVDHDHKHSVTPVYPLDESQWTLRDMLVIFTRKPKMVGIS